MNKKAVGLLSGGLDSALAIKIVLEQGIEVFCLHFVTPFNSCDKKKCDYSLKIATQFGLEIKTVVLTDEYLEIIKSPKYGYGSNLNPCIDCKILFFKKAKEFMNETGASFIITGEVLNQRLMSQRKDTMKLIETEAGVEGIVLRPLSAKLLPPSLPEKIGIVEREKLLDIFGRTRKRQIELAEKYNIKEFLPPAGGCLLTDPIFAKKLADLMEHNKNFTLFDINLLKLGRHFRLSENTKLVIGRNEEENQKLEDLYKTAKETEISKMYIFYPQNTVGPVSIGIGEFDKNLFILSTKIIARYCDKIDKLIKIIVKQQNNLLYEFETLPISDEELKNYRI